MLIKDYKYYLLVDFYFRDIELELIPALRKFGIRFYVYNPVNNIFYDLKTGIFMEFIIICIFFCGWISKSCEIWVWPLSYWCLKSSTTWGAIIIYFHANPGTWRVKGSWWKYFITSVKFGFIRKTFSLYKYNINFI